MDIIFKITFLKWTQSQFWFKTVPKDQLSSKVFGFMSMVQAVLWRADWPCICPQCSLLSWAAEGSPCRWYNQRASVWAWVFVDRAGRALHPPNPTSLCYHFNNPVKRNMIPHWLPTSKTPRIKYGTAFPILLSFMCHFYGGVETLEV